MRICLVLEGSYPYVHGGVSTWMHAYIQAMPQQEFSLWVIGAKAQDRGKFVYELPPNVKEVEEVFLDDALRLHGERHPVLFTADERTALRELVRLGRPDWDVLYRLFQEKGVHPLSFLQSRDFMELFTDICMREYPYVAYADAFHTMRSMLLPVLYLLTGRVPKADVYHAISTGGRSGSAVCSIMPAGRRSRWGAMLKSASLFQTASSTSGSAISRSNRRMAGWISAQWCVWLLSRTSRR